MRRRKLSVDTRDGVRLFPGREWVLCPSGHRSITVADNDAPAIATQAVA